MITRPDFNAQFRHNLPKYRWPREAVLRQIVEYNSLLFAQLEPIVGSTRAVEMIVCAVMRVRW